MVDPEKQGEFHLIILVCHFCRASLSVKNYELVTVFLETNYGICSRFPLKYIVLLNYGLRGVKKNRRNYCNNFRFITSYI